MKSIKLSILYGLAVWAIPFVVAIMIFPLRETERPLFESIMPVFVTLGAVLFADLYFKKVEGDFVKEGILLGLIWLAINLAEYPLMFMYGPMKMAFADYVKDIGITYLIIPVITIGCGLLLQNRSAK
jgi:hypothetical protein